jgi:hypothetical protein
MRSFLESPYRSSSPCSTLNPVVPERGVRVVGRAPRCPRPCRSSAAYDGRGLRVEVVGLADGIAEAERARPRATAWQAHELCVINRSVVLRACM